MAATAEQIVTEALTLTPRGRAFVAERLIESLDDISGDSLSAAWRTEIQKRCHEIDTGSVELRDSVDVLAVAYAALK